MTNWVVPILIAGILLFGVIRGVNVFDVFISGAKEGLHTAIGILPALIALMTCVGMFKASGGLDVLMHALVPLTNAVGFPREALPLALLRPISGSGALVAFEDILRENGPDSFAGRVAGVLMGSTETTFYTVAVYFGAVKVSRTRHTLGCALTSDLAGFLLSAAIIRLFFPI